MNQLVPLTARLPALIRAAGTRADVLLGILCLQHPQPAHTPPLWPLDCGPAILRKAANAQGPA